MQRKADSFTKTLRNSIRYRIVYSNLVGAVLRRTIGVNLAIFHGVLGTVDINMPPLQGWILLLDVFL